MRASLLTAGAAGLMALAGCGGAPARTAEAGPSPRDLEAHARFLASDALEGRMTGTSGYRVAAEYVASEFRRIGLEPGTADGYLQNVTYSSAKVDIERSGARFHRKGKARKLEWKKDWVTGRHVLNERSHVRAPAVFVGYGVRAPELQEDDYQGIDARGKIVVMLLTAPKRFPDNERAYYATYEVKAAEAVAHGAVGFVFLRDAYFAEHYPWDKMMMNAGKVPNLCWRSPDGKPGGEYFPELKADAWLSDDFAADLFAGAPQSYAQVIAADKAGQAIASFALDGELEFDERAEVSTSVAPNVVGVLRGSDPELAKQHVLYTAHLDHIGIGTPVNGDSTYNGYYDNAMGTSVMLETARAFAALRERPKRSVLFVSVGGEERGLLGSDYFASFPPVPIGSIVADVNLDMPLFLFPADEIVAFGAENSSMGEFVDRAAAQVGLRSVPDPNPGEVHFIRSDQYSLVRRGVPAVFLVVGNHSTDPSIDGAAVQADHLKEHLHKPSDDATRPVHWPSVVRFTTANFLIGLGVANAATPPQWKAGNFFGEHFGADRVARP